MWLEQSAKAKSRMTYALHGVARPRVGSCARAWWCSGQKPNGGKEERRQGQGGCSYFEQGQSGCLHFDGMGHSGLWFGMFASSAAKGMQVRTEHKVVPLAQRYAELSQGAFDPCTFCDATRVTGKPAQLVQQRVAGGTQATVRLHHKWCEVISPRLLQGVLADSLLCTLFGCRACCGGRLRGVCVSTAMSHRDIGQEQAGWQDGVDVCP
jgi:hypothetical protein